MQRQLAQIFSALVLSKVTLLSSGLALPIINNGNGNSITEGVSIVAGIFSIMLCLSAESSMR